MSTCLTIGSCTFKFPESGDCAGYGEEVHCWAVAITNKVGAFTGPCDIPLTTVCVTDGQCTWANVGSGSSLLKFSNAATRSFNLYYFVYRVACSTVSEAGVLTGIYNGSCCWRISRELTGCAGICFQITGTGQIQYKTTDLTGVQTTGQIKFSTLTRTLSQ